ncbi:MAG TPA: tetratricopeptide repeat protein, partial [Polyangiaceae bacterium]
PLAHLEMATLLLATKEHMGAAAHARRALELDPAAARAHVLLAEALLESGDREEALAELERAQPYSPNDARAQSLRERLAESEPKRRSSWIDRLLKR